MANEDKVLNDWETAIVRRALHAYINFEETNDLEESIAARKVAEKLFPGFSEEVSRG